MLQKEPKKMKIKYSNLYVLRSIAFILMATNLGVFPLVSADENTTFPEVVYSTVVNAYTQFHEYPELGLKETQTCAYLRKALKEMGFENLIELPKLPTAVIAVWDTGREGSTIALRSEMDARPTQEPSDHTPCSRIDGVMHNCGHDIHTAILLGVAKAVSTDDSAFRGKVVFVFQPAEEVKGGADDIVASGILKKLGVQAMFAQHVAPGTPLGTWQITPGAVMAGSNYFTITIKGKGSHAAAPSAGSDIPLVAARLIETLSSIPARNIDLLNDPMVLSVTQIQTGQSNALNVLPAEATIGGTIRAFYDLDTPLKSSGLSAHDILSRATVGIANAYGVEIDFNLRKATPPTVNNTTLAEIIIPQLQEEMPDAVEVAMGRGMFSEDFAYYTPHHPCLYFSLGIMKDGLGKGGLHTADFDIHPDTLKEGLYFMWQLAQIASNSELPDS
jgi:amidohydrolase